MQDLNKVKSKVNNKDMAWQFGRMIDAADAIKPRSNSLKRANSDVVDLHIKWKWLNNDRIGNLVFWFGMSTGTLISFLLTPKANSGQGFSYSALVIFLLTLIGVPLLVRHFAKTSFVKEDIFVNSEGRELKVPKDLPMGFFVIVSTIGSMILTGLLLDKYHVSNLIGAFISIPLFFGIPTLFFIFKNCPISILFNRKAWTTMAKRGNVNNFNNFHSSTLSNTDIGWRNSALYSYRPGNIYNSNR